MRFSYSVLIYASTFLNCYAQLASSPPAGPRALGMAGANVVLADSWSLFNNPAGLANHQNTQALFAYRTILDFTPFNTFSAGIALPTSMGNTGISTYRFGDDLFNTQMLSGSIGRKVGMISFGLRANYLQYNILGFGRKGVFSADIGVIAELLPQMTFGMSVSNFSQSKLSAEANERIPTIIRLGLAYHPTQELLILVEGEKDVDLNSDLKFGMEYQIIEKLHIRTGFSTATKSHSFGAGILINRFEIDYGVRINRFLGHNHNLGIQYALVSR